MVEFAKGKALIGPAITLIGGVSALIVGVIEYEYFSSIPGYVPPVVPQLNYNPIVILILGILGLLVGILAVINIKLINYITIVLGLVGIIYMMFVPAFRYVYLYSIPYHYFVLAWIGSPIILVGGLISAIIRHTIFK